MNLEIIPKLQWYRRLLRRFDAVFTGQAALQTKVDEQIGAQRLAVQEIMSELHSIHTEFKDITEKYSARCLQDFSCLTAQVHQIEKKLYRLQQQPFPLEIEEKSSEYQRLLRLHKLLYLRDVEDGSFIRIGREHDGGYLMLDEFCPDMVAYSFGICDDVSWDKAIAEKGIACFMYDHTINRLPEEHELFHWSQEGICDVDKVEHCSTLETFIKRNGHEGRTDLILKMDVEGAEWNAIAATDSSTLAQFSQMVFELHDMYSSSLHGKICKFLSKINKTHQPVYVHGNNWADYERTGNLVMPWALEVLYLRKSDHNFRESAHFYPLEQDMPNNADFSDIRLGVWNI